ncbi:MAG: sensor histidine kinase [Sphingobacteriales bacterium]|nr:sensor histidine kinase [Sphingobacteriales bacterium]
MKGLLRNSFVVSVGTGISYFLLWALAILISVNYTLSEFKTAYMYSCWSNLFGFAVCLLLFHVLLVIIRTRKRKVLWGIAAGILVLFLLSVVYQGWLKLGMRLGAYPVLEKEMFSSGYVIRGVVYLLYGIAYFTTIKLLLYIIRLNQHNSRLLLEKKTAELSFLKSQTNPHFLFNTLNNLYGSAVQGSSQTADAILRLSEILRFMLYESDQAFIPVGKELKIIREYIELERMRYDQTLMITMEAEIDDEQRLIPPLLLMPLVENAFKHGVSDTLEHPFIHIRLQVLSSSIRFEVRNSKSSAVRDNESNGRIGLGNLRRQLELLFAEYSLDITDEPASYSVKLFINLNKHATV